MGRSNFPKNLLSTSAPRRSDSFWGWGTSSLALQHKGAEAEQTTTKGEESAGPQRYLLGERGAT
jgi:hypothetical protein